MVEQGQGWDTGANMEVENYRYRTVLIISNNFFPVKRGALVDMSEEVAT